MSVRLQLENAVEYMVAGAIDFELLLSTRINDIKKQAPSSARVHLTWNKASSTKISFTLEESPTQLLSQSERARLFAKAVMVPQLKKLMDAGYDITITPNPAGISLVPKDMLEKVLLPAVEWAINPPVAGDIKRAIQISAYSYED